MAANGKPSILGWSSCPDGTLNRPLDSIESSILEIINQSTTELDQQCGDITQRLKLKLPDRIGGDGTVQIRCAWQVLGRLQPLLHATYPQISGTNENGRQVITLERLDSKEWMEKSFCVDPGKDNSKPFEMNHTSGVSSVTLACWVPRASELIIRTSQLRLDTIGMLKITNTFMIVLASVIRLGVDADVWSYASDVRCPTLNPGVDHMLGLGNRLYSKPLQAHLEKVGEDHRDGIPHAIGLAPGEGLNQSGPGNSRSFYMTFDESTSAAIKDACKARGIDVSAAFYATIIRIFASFPQEPKARNVLVSIVSDLRRLLHPLYRMAEYAVGPCSFPVCYGIRNFTNKGDSEAFDRLARNLATMQSTDLSRMTVDPTGNPVSFLEVLNHRRRRREAVPVDAKQDSQRHHGRFMPRFHNVEIIDELLKEEYKICGDKQGACEIEDIWIAADAVESTPQFQMLTFRATIRLYFSFHTACYDEDVMANVFRRVREDLLKELKVETKGSEPSVSTYASLGAMIKAQSSGLLFPDQL